MNYIANSKHRRLKHTVNIIIGRIGFNVLHLSGSERITAVGGLIALVGCLFPWFSIESDTYTAFGLPCGYVGFIILAVGAILALLLISERSRERLKTRVHLPIHDHTLIAFAGVLTLTLSLTVFNTIRAYTMFSAQVHIGSGSAIAFTGGVFVLLGGLLAYREEKQELLKRIYMENSQTTTDTALQEYRDILDRKGKGDGNMQLPV